MGNVIKTNFKCMGGMLFAQNTLLGGVYRVDKRILWGTFLIVLRLCTLSVTAMGERLSR